VKLLRGFRLGRWLRSWKRPPLFVLAAAAAVGAIAFFDSQHDVAADFSLFYVAAVAGVGWWLGRRYAFLAAAASAAAWISAALSERSPAAARLIYWNGFTRFAIFVFAGLVVARIRRDRRRLRRSRRALEKEIFRASTDPVTHLPSARGFLERLDVELADRSRRGLPFGCASIDVDGLRRYHDRHADPASDELARRIADLIRRSVRASDTPARLDRDEFAVAFWDADPAAVEKTLGRVISGIAALGRDDPAAPLAATVGLAWFDSPPEDPREALRRAGEARKAARIEGLGALRVWSATTAISPERAPAADPA